MSLVSDRQKGDYLSTLLVLQDQSDLFLQLYRIVEVHRSFLKGKVDELHLKERLDMVKDRDLCIQRARSAAEKGILGYPATGYLRKLDQQQEEASRLLTHLYQFTFEHLQLDETIYNERLRDEMQIWRKR